MVNTNTGQQQPFVKSFEMAIMQFVVLNKTAQQGEITKENIQSVFKGNLQMGTNHLDECLNILTQTGHLRQNGNKYTITDDGREDVQKVQNLVLELPQIVQQTGQQARSGNVGAGQTGQGQPKGTQPGRY